MIEIEIEYPESWKKAKAHGLPCISIDERASRRWFYHHVDWPDPKPTYTSHSLLECFDQIRHAGYTEALLISPDYQQTCLRLRWVDDPEPQQENGNG